MMPPKSPTPPTQPSPNPAGSDFAKFDRAIPPTFTGAIPDDVLAQIKETTDNTPPASLTAQVPVPPITVTNLNPEQQAEEQYRAFLRQEETRLASVVKPPPLPIHTTTSVVPSFMGGGQSEPRLKHDADSLHVESYFFLRRIVAGGSPLLAMLDIKALSNHIAALRSAIEWHPAPVKPVGEPTPIVA